MAKGPLVAGAVLLLLGSGALGYGVTRKAGGGMTPAATAAISAAVSGLDGDIKAARASVEQRARTLADFPALKNIIGSDAGTVKDMIGKEIAFKLVRGEVIEIGQIPADGKFVELVTLPDSGMRSSYAGKAGAFVELANDMLLVTQTAEVVPRYNGSAIKGFLTVTKPLDLEPSFDRLTAAGISGHIEIGDKQRAFGTAPTDPATTWLPIPIPSHPGVTLVAAAPPKQGGMPLPVIASGAGAAALGLVLVLIGMMSGKAKTGLTRFPQGADATQLAGTFVGSPPSTGTTPNSPTINLANMEPGAQIGRWQVVRRLGSGGMADVYLCQARGEAGFEKLVALKLMHSHLARNQRAVDHFLDEARLAARVVHPNVAAILDLGKIGEDYMIVMEYVEGMDLEKLLTAARDGDRPVPVNVALGILCRICDGLNAAHIAISGDGTPMGIIHRDVKAANVLISKQGGVKVVDFGIAKAATQAHLTVAGETKGTPSMMAPEQRVGEQVDVRADVYSTGAVAYELLTGHAVNLDLATLAHLGVENWPHLPPPSQLRSDLPHELDKLVLASMSFERDKRPANCADFEAQLDAVMKANKLSASDKDIARWADGELRRMNFVPTSPDREARPATATKG